MMPASVYLIVRIPIRPSLMRRGYADDPVYPITILTMAIVVRA